MTLIDFLNVIMENESIDCYECKEFDLVTAGEGCQTHANTKCESLVLVAIGQISKWYRLRALQYSAKGFTIPYISYVGQSHQMFIVDLKLGLRSHFAVRLKSPEFVNQLISETAHLEFGSLIRDLSVTDKVITPASQSTSSATPVLGTETLRLIETQKELNTIKKG